MPEASAPRCVAPQAVELERLEGIYEISYHTHNRSSCDAEGPSVLEVQENRWLAVRRGTDSEPALVLGECPDLESCRALAARQEPAVFVGQGGYECSIGDGSLYGRTRHAGTLEAELCKRAAHVDGFLIPEADGALRIESKHRNGDYPAPRRGCSLAAAERASAALPCSYRVQRAERVAPL